MCGIAGIVRTDGAPAEQAEIQSMTDVVAHRGPDGQGHFLDGPVALGHRRLSILDLSDHGRQPMHYADGALVMTYNGEIYNYIEIRGELRALGYEFESETDSEVVLAAYDCWGEGCVERFNGMWAFAIYDRPRRRLFMSRDRFGIKPFYYAQSGHRFVFGSEIRQLLPFGSGARANLDVVRTFLVTDAAELDDATFFADVRKLQGGHNAVYDLGSNRFKISRFYELVGQREISGLAAPEAIERFGAMLSDAVRLRLRSDVKVGTCLSGGLDSSTVATLASEIYHRSAEDAFAAITAVSEQESNNEARFAQLVVESNALDWHPVRPSYQGFSDTLQSVVRAQEEPFGSPSLTMQYFVMKAARENGITVLLDGQGGDETLLGYEKYYAAYIASSFRRDGVAATIAAARSAARNNAKMGPMNLAKYLVGGMLAPARYAYYTRRHSYFKSRPPRPPHLSSFARNCLNSFELQKLEVLSTNLPILLRYEDKNSMAHGIETRLPFLDYRLLEMSLSLPDGYKIRDGWTKWILRKVMNGRMPDAIVWRKNKFGFEAPENLWLKRHHEAMRTAIEASPMLRELTDTRRLSSALGKLDRRSLWRLYSLALWEDMFRVSI